MSASCLGAAGVVHRARPPPCRGGAGDVPARTAVMHRACSTRRCATRCSAAASGCVRSWRRGSVPRGPAERHLPRHRARLRDRVHPHVLADPRRPAGDGRRRPAAREADGPTCSARRTPSSPATPCSPRRSHHGFDAALRTAALRAARSADHRQDRPGGRCRRHGRRSGPRLLRRERAAWMAPRRPRWTPNASVRCMCARPGALIRAAAVAGGYGRRHARCGSRRLTRYAGTRARLPDCRRHPGRRGATAETGQDGGQRPRAESGLQALFGLADSRGRADALVRSARRVPRAGLAEPLRALARFVVESLATTPDAGRTRVRIDQLLVQRGLAASRDRAPAPRHVGRGPHRRALSSTNQAHSCQRTRPSCSQEPEHPLRQPRRPQTGGRPRSR